MSESICTCTPEEGAKVREIAQKINKLFCDEQLTIDIGSTILMRLLVSGGIIAGSERDEFATQLGEIAKQFWDEAIRNAATHQHDEKSVSVATEEASSHAIGSEPPRATDEEE